MLSTIYKQIKKISQPGFDFFYATPLPHCSALLCILMSIIMVIFSIRYYTQHPVEFMLTALIACSWITGLFFSIADIISRYREAKRIISILNKYGCRESVFKAKASSRCQRDAALWAATKAGYRQKAQAIYQKMGYRWYHFLPDQILARPWIIFQPSFLKKAFYPGKNK